MLEPLLLASVARIVFICVFVTMGPDCKYIILLLIY